MAEQVRGITDAEREDYARDGAVVLRDVIPERWLERMRTAIDRYHEATPTRTVWMSRCDPEFRAFVTESGLGAAAAEIMGVDHVRAYFDQLFVKPAQSDNPTPLHQDLPYWPVDGADIVSLWVPFDPVRAENSVVQYVRGSHRWGRMFEPAPFRKGAEQRDPALGSAGYEQIEDPQALIAANDVLCWELQPGDVLVHHPLTLHFATPNRSANAQRRAIALRYVGPDAHFMDRPGHFMRGETWPAHWPQHAIIDGAPLSGEDYPAV